MRLVLDAVVRKGFAIAPPAEEDRIGVWTSVKSWFVRVLRIIFRIRERSFKVCAASEFTRRSRWR